MRPLLLALLIVLPLAAADAVADARARHAWTWFGLPEAEAQATATRAGLAFLVVLRDGQPVESEIPAGPALLASLHQGIVLHARVRDAAGQERSEGAADPGLVPFLGQTEAIATAAAQAADRPVRVVQRDGESFPVTMDYRPDRVNLQIAGGIVIAADGG